MGNRQNSCFEELQEKLKIDCEKCSGLCCVALFCMKTDGFPADKEAGIPCRHLMSDFRCDIHSSLMNRNMKGCLIYDCFGAGQKVTEKYGSDITWKTNTETAEEIFDVFLIVFQLHQMAWYLVEALRLVGEEQVRETIENLLWENERITSQSPDAILHLDIEEYRSRVNQILKRVSDVIANDSAKENQSKDCFGKNFKGRNLDGNDFSMGLLIAANLEGCSLRGTNFLGADMRDANVKNTDLSNCAFLTQMQLNSTKGNGSTKIPVNLLRPSAWEK